MQSVVIEDANWRDEFGKKLFDLQQSGQFCDVIIKTIEDARLLVHSCVLAASSPLLKGVIESALSDATLGTIMLSSDIDVNTWTHMLEFMYTGYATVPDTLVASLQSGATILKVDTLVNKCNEVLPNLTKLEEGVEAVPVEEADFYSAIAQIKEDSEAVEGQNSIVTVTQDDLQVQGSIVTQHTLPEGTIVTQTDIDETQANFDEAQTDLVEANTISENVQEKVEDVQADITEEPGMEGQEAIAAAQDEMDTDYIDDVHDASATLNYIANSARSEATEPTVTEDYKTVFEVEDFISSNVPPSSPITTSNIQPSTNTTIEAGTTQILIQGNVDSATRAQIIFDTTVAQETEDQSIHEYELVGYTTGGKKQYRCCLCNALTLDPSAHRPVHTNECPYVCSEPGCGKAYKRKSALKHHYNQIHTEVIPQHCMKCGKAFNNKYLLQKHVTMTCTDSRPFVCRQCGKSFKVLARLKYHEGSHAVNKPFKCETCGKGMASKAHLRVHMVVHEQGSYECQCGKNFSSLKRYKEHYRQMHSDSNPHRCNICQRNFKNQFCLEKHMQRHEKTDKLYLCQICRRGFKNNITCAWHEKRNHNIPHPDLHDVENDTTCPVCLKEMKNKPSLLTHILIHADGEEGQLPCPKCDKVFTRKKHLDSHLQDVHVDRTMPCPTCNKMFKHEKHLKEHMNSHTKPYECSICGARFANERYLRKHEADHEKGLIVEKTYICPHCNEVFPTATNFRIHAKEYHADMPKDTNVPIRDGVKAINAKAKLQNRKAKSGIFNCELCDSTFDKESNLAKHELKKHMDAENRLTCSDCSVKFITPRTLKKHRFEEHLEGEEMPCKICKREFYNADDLEYHNLAVHMNSLEIKIEQKGYRLNICVLCSKCFRDPESLITHENNHNKEDLVCTTCEKHFNKFSILKSHIHCCSYEKCFYCLEEFSSKEERDDHVETHENGFVVCKCELCPEVFQSQENFNEHKQTCSKKVLSAQAMLDTNQPDKSKGIGQRLFMSMRNSQSPDKIKSSFVKEEDNDFKSLLLSFSK